MRTRGNDNQTSRVPFCEIEAPRVMDWQATKKRNMTGSSFLIERAKRSVEAPYRSAEL
jgi:hypothetical protein